MKLIHLSDLHLGIRLGAVSLLEDQADILQKILTIVADEKPDAVLIAGDIYDKTVPPAEAVDLFDTFLVNLANLDTKIFIISGNHDSPERIAFGGRLMTARGVYVSPVYSGDVSPIMLADPWGEAAVYLLPFVKPSNVRRFFPEQRIESYTDAIAAAVQQMNPAPTRRNILVTHQFVSGAGRCDSETTTVGGTDNVDPGVFAGFDYVALGHIHGPQAIGRPTLRYCGTPLKYSFSEVAHRKSVTVAELREKGDVSVRTVPLSPLRDLRCIRGSYQELTLLENYRGTQTADYLHITLTDEEDIPGAIGRLRSIYPNILSLEYDNLRTRSAGASLKRQALEHRSEQEWFAKLYQEQNGQPMGPEQTAYCEKLLDEIREELQ